MKILVIGGSGREHALSWRFASESTTDRIYCIPGNAGIMDDAWCFPGKILDIGEMASFAEFIKADCTVVGPLGPLAAGIVDEFKSRGLSIIGPSQAAARLEHSKVFAKEFMNEIGLPSAQYSVLENASDINAVVGKYGYPVVLNADDPSSAEAVSIVRDEEAARNRAREMLAAQAEGLGGSGIVVEQFLEGHEVSVAVLSDGHDYCVLPTAREYRRALDGDHGPNTHGMGAYCDDSILTEATRDRILDTVVEPLLVELHRRGRRFSGFLRCGLKITTAGPKLFQISVRMGDPETQPMLYRLRGSLAHLLSSSSSGALDPSVVTVNPRPATCVVMASRGYPGHYTTGHPVQGLRQAERTGAKVFHSGTKMWGGKALTAGGRVLGVTASGKNLIQATRNAYQAVDSIRFKGSHYRRDIARLDSEDIGEDS